MNQLQVDTPEEKPTLTDFLRAKTKFIIDPIVTFMARYRFSPDTLTVLGMLFHFFYAWLIANGQMLGAAILMIFLVPLDALDGALARKLGREAGGFGAFLDSTLDRFAEIVLFGGFIYYYVNMGNEWMLVVTYAAITGSIMVSYTRARAESLEMNAKIGVLSRLERYVVLVFFMVINQPHIGLIILAVFTYFTAFQRMYHVWKQARPSNN